VEIEAQQFSRSGRATIGRPTSTGCLAFGVVAMAVESLRLPQSALGEVLPDRVSSGLDCAAAVTFFFEWNEEDSPTNESDCSEQEDSTKEGGVSEEVSPRSSSEGNASVAEQRRYSIMIRRDRAKSQV